MKHLMFPFSMPVAHHSDGTGTTEAQPKTNEREEERKASSTERYSLNNEVSNVIKEDSTFTAGLPVSEKYGPTMDDKADTAVSESSSSKEAIKVATRFATNITTRALLYTLPLTDRKKPDIHSESVQSLIN